MCSQEARRLSLARRRAALVEHFFEQAKKKHPRSPVEKLSVEALARLWAHSWPGNARELEHVIERAVLLGRESTISSQDLPPTVTEVAPSAVLHFAGPLVSMRELQRRYVAWAFEQLGGRKRQTAEKLGVDHKTLSKWLAGEEDSERKE